MLSEADRKRIETEEQYRFEVRNRLGAERVKSAYKTTNARERLSNGLFILRLIIALGILGGAAFYQLSKEPEVRVIAPPDPRNKIWDSPANAAAIDFSEVDKDGRLVWGGTLEGYPSTFQTSGGQNCWIPGPHPQRILTSSGVAQVLRETIKPHYGPVSWLISISGQECVIHKETFLKSIRK